MRQQLLSKCPGLDVSSPGTPNGRVGGVLGGHRRGTVLTSYAIGEVI